MRPTDYQSFMLRLEHIEQPGERGTWRSEVKHIQSGTDYRFDSLDDLVAFLQHRIESTLPECREEDPGHSG